MEIGVTHHSEGNGETWSKYIIKSKKGRIYIEWSYSHNTFKIRVNKSDLRNTECNKNTKKLRKDRTKNIHLRQYTLHMEFNGLRNEGKRPNSETQIYRI